MSINPYQAPQVVDARPLDASLLSGEVQTRGGRGVFAVLLLAALCYLMFVLALLNSAPVDVKAGWMYLSTTQQ